VAAGTIRSRPQRWRRSVRAAARCGRCGRQRLRSPAPCCRRHRRCHDRARTTSQRDPRPALPCRTTTGRARARRAVPLPGGRPCDQRQAHRRGQGLCCGVSPRGTSPMFAPTSSMTSRRTRSVS
jgi:hypothetical protein